MDQQELHVGASTLAPSPAEANWKRRLERLFGPFLTFDWLFEVGVERKKYKGRRNRQI